MNPHSASGREAPLKKCYNILVPGETIDLEPVAKFTNPGHLHNLSKSAVRALEVLEIFSAGQPKVKGRHVSRILGISPSSADQLLKSLVDSAFLIFDPISKFYGPSPRLANLAKMLSLTFEEDRSSEALVQTVSDELGLNGLLMVSQGTYMQVAGAANLEPVPSNPRPARFPWIPIVGMRVPLFGSTTGAAWLSTQSEAVVREAIAMCRRELGPMAENPEQILASLALVRNQGYAFGGTSRDDDQWGISVPLPPSRHGDVFVLCVWGPKEEVERNRVSIAGYLRKLVGLPECGPTVE
jgi:DNA-binding IclR family transcriptional regulator